MKRLLTGLASLMLSATASAEPAIPLQFSGFGTLGVAFNHDDQADYVAAYEELEGVGRTQSKDYGLDTVFGIQADAALAPGLSATVQMQSRRLSNGSSTPYFEWANLKYQFNPDLSIRLGRVVTPMFMVSESRAVGYAQTAARLPGEVYLLNPITYVDGGGITQQFEIGNTLMAANFTSGKLSQKLPTIFDDLNIDYDINLASISAEHDNSTFRLSLARAVLDFNNDTLALLDEVIRILDVQGIAGASQYRELARVHDFRADFLDIGYLYDRGQWQVQAEFIARRSDAYIVTDNDAFYLQGAYRIGSWTPFLRYSQANSLNDRSKVPTLSTGNDDSELLALMVDGVNGFGIDLKTLDERSAWTLGTRWDVADNYALKLQYDAITKPEGSATLFTNYTDRFRDTRQHVDVYAVTLDFVF